MAGKHYGTSQYFGENFDPNATPDKPANPPAFPGSKENKAWSEGADGSVTPNPFDPVADPVAYNAYVAGANSARQHEAAPDVGNARPGGNVDPLNGWFYVKESGTRTGSLPPSSTEGIDDSDAWDNDAACWGGWADAIEAAADYVNASGNPATFVGIVIDSGVQTLPSGFTNSISGPALKVITEGRDSTSDYRVTGNNNPHYNPASNIALEMRVRVLKHSQSGTATYSSNNGRVVTFSQANHIDCIFYNCEFNGLSLDRAGSNATTNGGLFAMTNNATNLGLEDCVINDLDYKGTTNAITRNHAAIGMNNWNGELVLRRVTFNNPTLEAQTNTNCLALVMIGEDPNENFATRVELQDVAVVGGSVTSAVAGASLGGLFSCFASANGMGISGANERLIERCSVRNFTADGQGTATVYGSLLFLESGYGRARLRDCVVEDIDTETSQNALGGMVCVLGDHGTAASERASATLERCVARRVNDRYGGLCYATAGGSATLEDCIVEDCDATKPHVAGGNVPAAGTGLYKGGSGNMTARRTTVNNCTSARVSDNGKACVFLSNTNTGALRDCTARLEQCLITGSPAEDPTGPPIVSVQVSQDNGFRVDLNMDGTLIANCGSTEPDTNQVYAVGAGATSVARVLGGSVSANRIYGGDGGVRLGANATNTLVGTVNVPCNTSS